MGFLPPMISDNAQTHSLHSVRTRLNKFSEKEQGHLINWGYALTDAAMRRYLLERDVVPGKWPVPEYPL